MWSYYLLQVDKEYLVRKANEQAIKLKNSRSIYMMMFSFSKYPVVISRPYRTVHSSFYIMHGVLYVSFKIAADNIDSSL